MHEGEDTDYYLRKGYDVVAFEADPKLIDHCRSRFSIEISDGRLRIVAGAIVAHPGGKVPFYRNRKLSVWSTTDKAWALRNSRLGGESIEVEVDTVDASTVFRDYGIPHFAKIDVEGADRLVLEALRQSDSRPNYISIESEKVDFAKLKEEFHLLQSLGYTKFRAVQQASVPGRALRTTSLRGDPLYYVFANHASGPFGEDLKQEWLTAKQCLRKYRSIFLMYHVFGDSSFIRTTRKGRRIISYLDRRAGHAVPGWYDTHAMF